MDKDKRLFSFRKIWTWIGIPILSVVLNAIVSDVQENNGLLALVISLVFLACMIAVLFWFHSKMIVRLTENFYYFKLREGIVSFSKELKMRLITQEEIADPTKQNIGIVAEHELASMEATQMFDEIWVISNDLSAEVGQYSDIVPNNLKKGVKYKFFYQNTAQNAIRVEQIKRNNNYSPNARYYCLHDDFFFIVANLDFTIYDPYSDKRIGYMGIELPNADELYAIKVDNNLTDAIASKLVGYLIDEEVIL